MKLKGTDISSPEFMGNLDFWVSYYVTSLIRATDLPENLWCDGSVWANDHHTLELIDLSNNQYSLKAELDIQDDNSSYKGSLVATFDYDSKFEKFVAYKVQLSVLDNEYLFSTK